jgi:glycine/D-amino acid oxidase-like deaminating enzyme
MTYLNLNAGDEVGIARRSRYGLASAAFGRVVKINGHGHIYVDLGKGDYVRFDKNGNAYKNSYGPSLVDADKLRKEIAQEERRKDRARVAREMEQALKDGWSHSGTWHPSQERIDTLKNLIAEMEKLVDA